MAEPTRIFTKQDGTLYIAAGGGGAYNAAGNLIAGCTEYEVDFDEGDLDVTFPYRTVTHIKTRGRTTNPPTLRHGDDEPGSLSFSAKHRDSANATDATLADILLWAAGMTIGVPGASWESTSASSLGADDADVRTVGLKWVILDEGDATHTRTFVFNYVELGSAHLTEGDPNNIPISGVIHDRIENIIAL